MLPYSFCLAARIPIPINMAITIPAAIPVNIESLLSCSELLIFFCSTFGSVGFDGGVVSAGFDGGVGLDPITYSTRGTSQGQMDEANFLKEQLAKIGIKLEVEVLEFSEFLKQGRANKLQFWTDSWIYDYPDAENYLSLFYSKNFCPNGPNYTHFRNQEFDNLYEESLSELNDSIRALNYQRMDQIIMDTKEI